MFLRPSVIALTILSFIGLCAPRCNAWNSTGHEIIAQIAYDQLSPQAKSAIFAVLRNHPRLNEDLLSDPGRAKDADLAMFLRSATWPDMVRYLLHPLNHTENHPRWHYMDYPFELDGVQGPKPDLQWDGQSDPANLPQALDKALAELKDPQTPKDRKAIDLCWVEHLVGDIHQPLHATSMFSKEFPQGDQGGNLVFIKNAENVSLPLHTYWDDVEGLALDYDTIRKTADRIEAEHPAAQLKDRVSDLSVLDWAKESFDLAKSVVYINGTLPHVTKTEAISDPNSVPELPAGYPQQALATADERMALAGYRLAAVLEQVAKGL
ncbi:MAG: S1/P1 nuclease [Tepidisphaeraceae bacterium]